MPVLTSSATDLGIPLQSIDTNVTVSIESSNVFPPVIIIHGPVPVSEHESLISVSLQKPAES